jgi:hypothetical protein
VIPAAAIRMINSYRESHVRRAFKNTIFILSPARSIPYVYSRRNIVRYFPDKEVGVCEKNCEEDKGGSTVGLFRVLELAADN